MFSKMANCSRRRHCPHPDAEIPSPRQSRSGDASHTPQFPPYAVEFRRPEKEFDAIFVDISAFSASPDANAIAPELDGVLVVTSHGRTSIDDTMRVIDTLRNVGAEILGAIINHAPKE